MPKVTKTTASTHYGLPGVAELHESHLGGWAVSFASDHRDLDLSPLFKGAPENLCRATHLGYVIEGRVGYRMADGTDEVFEAGEAFVVGPGHTPLSFAGTEGVLFTAVEDAEWAASVMLPNLPEFAREHGIELPEQVKEMLKQMARRSESAG